MPDWVYVGTNPPVDANGTAALLRDNKAIWCPPSARNNGMPDPGDRLWLVWRPDGGPDVDLLGGGIVTPNQQTADVLWTEAHRTGLRAAAQAVGYSGPTNMAFLVLDPRTVFDEGDYQTFTSLGMLANGLNPATPQQVAILGGALPI